MLRSQDFLKSFHVSERFKAIYVNNPKCAYSTIKLAMQRAEVGDPTYLPVSSMHKHRDSPLLTWPELNEEKLSELLGKYYLFSFVRSPVGRLKSACLNKIVTAQKDGEHRVRAGFSRNYCPSFEEFVRSISRIGPEEQDPHWRLQTINLSFDRLTYAHIGKLESFEQDWNTICQATGMPIRVEFAGKKTSKKRKNKLSISDETRGLIAEIYNDDFRNFGYELADSASIT